MRTSVYLCVAYSDFAGCIRARKPTSGGGLPAWRARGQALATHAENHYAKFRGSRAWRRCRG
eukprot:12557596-Alexandrium_andersonii.AAC.1